VLGSRHWAYAHRYVQLNTAKTKVKEHPSFWSRTEKGPKSSRNKIVYDGRKLAIVQVLQTP